MTRPSLLVARVVEVPPNVGFPAEWDVVVGKGATEQVVATFPTETEAQACAKGYGFGVRHGQWAGA